MVLGNFKPEREELYHTFPSNLHEPPVFCREHKRRRVAEVYEAKLAAGVDFTVENCGNLARACIHASAKGIPRCGRLGKSQVEFGGVVITATGYLLVSC